MQGKTLIHPLILTNLLTTYIWTFALNVCRKGMKSLVLEKSDKLRSAGAAIAIHANGWRALDQLMVGMELREKAIALSE